MKKNLFLFLLFLVFAGRASADGLPVTSCGLGSLTDGAFTACWGSGGLFIDGPEGIANIDVTFGPLVHSFFLNSSGEVAGSLEFAGDRSSFFYDYSGACSSSQSIVGSGGALPGSHVSSPSPFPFRGGVNCGGLGTFGFDPGPLLPDPLNPGRFLSPVSEPSLSPSVLITGLSETGVVTGIEHYDYEDNERVNIPVSWYLPALAVPEPNGLLLIASGLVFLPFFRSRFRSLGARDPEPATLMLLIPGLLALVALRPKKVTA
jgi:hypothetical protein